MSKSIGAGFLDDIKETVVDNQRVLAVKAMYRRKVSGSLLGSSKSGGIVYIAPQATLAYSREYQNLVYEEKQEVIKILRELATTIRPNDITFRGVPCLFDAHRCCGSKSKIRQRKQCCFTKNIQRKKDLF